MISKEYSPINSIDETLKGILQELKKMNESQETVNTVIDELEMRKAFETL